MCRRLVRGRSGDGLVCMWSVCMERQDRSSVTRVTAHTSHTLALYRLVVQLMCRVRVNSAHKSYLHEESGSLVPFDQT